MPYKSLVYFRFPTLTFSQTGSFYSFIVRSILDILSNQLIEYYFVSAFFTYATFECRTKCPFLFL